jgi:hypothetical protein
MNDERPSVVGRSETSGRRPLERTERHGRIAWADVDRYLEVRARVVVALDSIEDGDVRTAELCLLQLVDDLDAAEFLLARERAA